MLGPLTSASYERGFVRLEAGDMLVLFTDGIVEATDPEGHELGSDALAALVASLRELPAAEIVDRVLAEVDRFTADAPQSDDRTLVIVRRGER